MDFLEFIDKFPSKDKCIDYFIKIRYPEGIKCNHCDSNKVYKTKLDYKKFDCNGCDNTFSVFKDTIFEKSKTDLRKWFYAIHLMLNSKKILAVTNYK